MSTLPPLFPDIIDFVSEPSYKLEGFVKLDDFVNFLERDEQSKCLRFQPSLPCINEVPQGLQINEVPKGHFHEELFDTFEQIDKNESFFACFQFLQSDNTKQQLSIVNQQNEETREVPSIVGPIDVYAHQNNENLFANQPIQVPFVCTLLSRKGRNKPWGITNLSPQQIHKTRQILVEAPEGLPNCQCTIIFKLKQISGSEEGEICFLQNTEHMVLFDDALRVSKEVKMRMKDDGKGVSCFLHTAVCRPQNSGKAKYRVTVYCSMNNRRTLIHSFDTVPLRNHKWESGSKGKEQNNTNLICATANVPLM